MPVAPVGSSWWERSALLMVPARVTMGSGSARRWGDEGGGGVEEAVAFGGVVVEAFDGFGGEDDAGREAAEPFEEGGGVGEAEGGELVHKWNTSARRGVPGGAPNRRSERMELSGS